MYNYSMQVLKAQSAAKARGYSDVLYLDCVHKKYLEEVSSCNIFVVKVLYLANQFELKILFIYMCMCVCMYNGCYA